MRRIYSAIDIGSDSIKIVVCEYFNKKYNVLASNKYPSKSIKKGVVIDDELYMTELKNAFNEVENSLSVDINKVIANVPIYEAEYKVVEGYSTITNENHIVKGDDMVNALQASIYNKIEKSRELVTIIPIKYILDDDEKVVVKEPKGLHASKLKVYAMMVTVPKKNIYKIIAGIEKVGIEVVDILFGSLGDYEVFKSKELSKKTVGIINIGSDKTELSVINNGILSNSTVIQDGSRSIDNDISYVYNIKKSQGKRIKEIFALADAEYASTSEIYEVTNKSSIKTKISQYEVSKIVSSKLKDLLNSSKKELNHLTKKEISYIIITGGISNMPGFDDLSKEVIGNNYLSKKLNIIGVRDNSYSSSVGMIMYFVNKLKIRGKEYTMFDEDMQIDLSNNKSNENIFGKVFDYLVKNKED